MSEPMSHNDVYEGLGPREHHHQSAENGTQHVSTFDAGRGFSVKTGEAVVDLDLDPNSAGADLAAAEISGCGLPARRVVDSAVKGRCVVAVRGSREEVAAVLGRLKLNGDIRSGETSAV